MDTTRHPEGDGYDEHSTGNSPWNPSRNLSERNSRHHTPEATSQADRADEPHRHSMGADGPDNALEHGPDPQSPLYEVAHYRSGPFPPAQELADYGQVDPTYPDRILGMSEMAMRASISHETRLVHAESTSTLISSIAAPLVALASLGVTLWLGISGKTTAALATSVPFLGLTISQVVVTFSSRRSQD